MSWSVAVCILEAALEAEAEARSVSGDIEPAGAEPAGAEGGAGELVGEVE